MAGTGVCSADDSWCLPGFALVFGKETVDVLAVFRLMGGGDGQMTV